MLACCRCSPELGVSLPAAGHLRAGSQELWPLGPHGCWNSPSALATDLFRMCPSPPLLGNTFCKKKRGFVYWKSCHVWRLGYTEGIGESCLTAWVLSSLSEEFSTWLTLFTNVVTMTLLILVFPWSLSTRGSRSLSFQNEPGLESRLRGAGSKASDRQEGPGLWLYPLSALLLWTGVKF